MDKKKQKIKSCACMLKAQRETATKAQQVFLRKLEGLSDEDIDKIPLSQLTSLWKAAVEIERAAAQSSDSDENVSDVPAGVVIYLPEKDKKRRKTTPDNN